MPASHVSAPLCLAAPSTRSTARARDPLVVGIAALAAGAACRAYDTSGHEGAPVDIVVGGVHLVDGGDGAAASDVLHMPASLHFVSSKEMLRCAENGC